MRESMYERDIKYKYIRGMEYKYVNIRRVNISINISI